MRQRIGASVNHGSTHMPTESKPAKLAKPYHGWRYVTVASIEHYIASLPRTEYSRPTPLPSQSQSQKSDRNVKPLLVPIRVARLMLGGISHKTFWKLAGQGHFEVVSHLSEAA
jgi:hypothetical protein